MQLLFYRLITLFLSAGVGAWIVELSGLVHPLWGAVLAIALWLAWDTWRIIRLSRWFRKLQESPEQISIPDNCFGIWLEISERAHRFLRQQRWLMQQGENRMENLFAAIQASPNGIVMLDKQARITWCNQAACQHLNLDAKRDIAQSITHLLRNPDFIAYFGARNFGESITLNSPNYSTSHPLRISIQIYPYGQGQMLMLSRDITVFEQVDAMRRDFIANVSHEIKTPLTVLAGLIETLQTLPLQKEEEERYLEWMTQQTRRMQDLVNDLLTLSRLEDSPPPDPGESSAPVSALIQHCKTEFSGFLTANPEPHHISFPTAETLENAGEILGSATELQSVLSNLMSNAIRYTPPGSHIEIRWMPLQDGGATLSVRDDGPGIAPEHIPRLTERFYRVDSGRSENIRGTGLGLSIVKHILQRHDATLHIDSVLGQGACFTATFPESRIRNPFIQT